MQCLIDMINMPEEEKAMEEAIQNHVLELAFDPNGNHVLQKVMMSFKEDRIDFIFYPVLDKFKELSMDQNGLCVIKKLINKV